jgi:hypothetical protein
MLGPHFTTACCISLRLTAFSILPKRYQPAADSGWLYGKVGLGWTLGTLDDVRLPGASIVAGWQVTDRWKAVMSRTMNAA